MRFEGVKNIFCVTSYHKSLSSGSFFCASKMAQLSITTRKLANEILCNKRKFFLIELDYAYLFAND